MPEHDDEDAAISEEDRALVAALMERPEWEALTQLCKARMDKHFRKLARLFATEGLDPDYGRLQWQRGVFAGMKLVLDRPLIEARALARLLEKGPDQDDQEDEV